MPAAVKNPHANEVGAKLRELRLRAEWTLQDVERESIRRFGEAGVLKVAQVSRIENGGYGRLSIDDAVRLGELYGMTPNEVADMLGLYKEPKRNALPREMRQLEALYPSLPISVQEEVLSWLRFTLTMARAGGAKHEDAG